LIKNEFKNATMLTVAHRLNTIINNDQILVLGEGVKIEMGSPKELMEDPTSNFNQYLTEL